MKRLNKRQFVKQGGASSLLPHGRGTCNMRRKDR